MNLTKDGPKLPAAEILHALIALAVRTGFPCGTFNLDLGLHDTFLDLLQHGFAVLNAQADVRRIDPTSWADQLR